MIEVQYVAYSENAIFTTDIPMYMVLKVQLRMKHHLIAKYAFLQRTGTYLVRPELCASFHNTTRRRLRSRANQSAASLPPNWILPTYMTANNETTLRFLNYFYYSADLKDQPCLLTWLVTSIE